ncbi:hypothetical protein PHLCEN_2v13621 [Hermanssonia centrifuga]|uniref:Uncharacterized protein n=1 Tax=Hermanssonia centrifuga TaxID=98765 RepID=A0A2R6NDN2_9APHY|nr:hypothetical protein PHLCEN_2v13621 [Hermanssonia centrifuga]
MATYFVPTRQNTQRSVSDAFSSTSASRVLPMQEQCTNIKLEESIYIFPTPSSAPASPSGSSISSVPTDFTEVLSVSTGSRSRDQSFSSATGENTDDAAHEPSRTTYVESSSSGSRSTDIVEVDPEVEMWDWTDSGEDVPDDDGLWAFEAEVERASRWNIPNALIRRLSPLRTTPSTGATINFYEYPYRAHIRSRTQSSSTSYTSVSSKSSSAMVHTPHPRIQLPLLSFFSSLLSLNLDDSALRLLTHSSPDSVLFPGQSGFLSYIPQREPPLQHGSLLGYENEEVVESHGLNRLHAESSGHSLRGVKDGLAIIYDPSFALNSPFALPSFSSIAGLCRFVGNVWSNGGKAWGEAHTSETVS